MKTWRSSVFLGFVFCALGAAFLFLVMQPTVAIPFAHHDQYRFFREDGQAVEAFKSNPVSDAQYEWLRLIGRPIAAELEYQIFKRTYGIEDLNDARAVTLGFMSVVLSLWAVWLHRLGLSPVVAFCISAATFVLPGPQYTAFMASLNHPIAVLLGLAAAFVIEGVPPPRVWGSGWVPKVRALVCLPAATGLLVLALLSYPAIAFFSLLPTFARLILQGITRWRDMRWSMIRDMILAGIACIAYYILVRTQYQPASHPPMPAEWQMQVKGNLLQKLRLLLESVTVESLNLWHVPPTGTVALLVAGFILSGVVAYFLRGWKLTRPNGSRASRSIYYLQWIVAVCGLLAAGEIAYLAQPGLQSLYRIHVVLMAMIVLSIVGATRAWSLWWPASVRPQIMTGMALGCLAVSGLLGNALCLRNCLNDYLESTYIAAQLVPHLGKPMRRIHLVKPAHCERAYTGARSMPGDEINRNTLEYPHNEVDVVRAALLKVADRRSFITRPAPNTPAGIQLMQDGFLFVTVSEVGEPILPSPDMVIIDMNHLLRVSSPDRTRLAEIRSSEPVIPAPATGASEPAPAEAAAEPTSVVR